MACESEKREIGGFKADAKTVFKPPKREQGGSCALVALFMIGGFMAAVGGAAATVFQLFS